MGVIYSYRCIFPFQHKNPIGGFSASTERNKKAQMHPPFFVRVAEKQGGLPCPEEYFSETKVVAYTLFHYYLS